MRPSVPTLTKPFLDELGRRRLRESITAFLDVLCFSHTVVSAAEAGQSQQCLASVVQSLYDARALVRKSLSGHPLADPQRWEVK